MSLFSAQGAVDVMGRVAGFNGFDSTKEIPVGSRVRIHQGTYCSGCASRYYAGQEAVVTSRPFTSDKTTGPEVSVRFMTVKNDWDVIDNGRRFRPSVLEVLEVGNDTVTPGVSYPLAKIEVFTERFKTMDLTHQEYTNFPTFQAHIYLAQEERHVKAVKTMVLTDGSISRKKLERYFRSFPDLQPPSEDFYPDGFPQRLEFRLNIDWDDVAKQFEAQFAEAAAYA